MRSNYHFPSSGENSLDEIRQQVAFLANNVKKKKKPVTPKNLTEEKGAYGANAAREAVQKILER